MGYINPLFNNIEITKEKKSTPDLTKKATKQNRSTRSDKTHNIKFPVSTVFQIKLKSYFRQAKRIYQLQGKAELKQTKFNTLLLRYGLKHKELLLWNHKYMDTKVYMHTTLLEIEYQGEIGGPHGLTIQKNLSDRKIVYQIIISVLEWLEGEGTIEKIL